MAHGQPDYGMYAQKQTVFSISDMGELAARLGSVCTFDRRGDVIFIEDFNSGLSRWHLIADTADSSIAVTNERFRTRGLSCKMITGTDSDGAVQIKKYFPLPVYSGVGIELSFSWAVNLALLHLYTVMYDGTDYVSFWVRYTFSTKKLEILKSDSTWLDLEVTHPPYQYDTTLFSTLKLVVDYTTNKYKRVLFNSFSKELSEDGKSGASAVDPHIQIVITATGNVPLQSSIHLADIIFTQNEP